MLTFPDRRGIPGSAGVMILYGRLRDALQLTSATVRALELAKTGG